MLREYTVHSPSSNFLCIIRIVLHCVFKRSLRTTIHWQEQIALQCIGYFMPSTNHSHACKKFVPQRALAYTLSETYVGREKIDPYLQILYYISYLAKNSYKNGSKYTKFTKNKIIFNIIFILHSYVFYALFKK